MTRYTVHFSGHVQGVGFRMTTQRLARRHEVTGYVQNLTDGRVRMVAEGPETEIRDLIAEIQERMRSHINETQIDISGAEGDYDGFDIRR